MHKLDYTIARLRLLLAETDGKSSALAAAKHQLQEQIARLTSFVVHDEGNLDRTLTMMTDVDARLQELSRQEGYLALIREVAQRELDSLQLTKLIEEARARLAALRQQQGDGVAGGVPSDAAGVAAEIRRLEEVIAQASGAAAKSISDRA